MSQHLSRLQISEYLIGSGDPFGQWHARECPACRAEIKILARPLALFRASVHRWSERQLSAGVETAPVLQFTRESYDRAWYSAGAYSLLVHGAMAALLLVAGSVKPVQRFARDTATLIAPR